MRRLVQDDLVARAAVHRERHLIAHGAGGQEQGRLLAEQRRDHLLEPVHRRVLELLLVAHLGLAHEAAHGGRRTGDGVAAKVDRFHSHSLNQR